MNGYMMNASGMGYYEQGNYAMAAQEFQTALASSPRNPDYMANLAKARLKVGDQRGAEQLFQQALSLSPSHQPSYHGYSELMLAQGRTEEASRLLNTWAATQPYIAESHVELAWLQRELGQPDAAAQSLQTALQVNPSHATALAHLGQYYQDNGNPTQAVAMYQRSLQADWSQPEVHSRLAVAAEAAGPESPMGEMAMARGVRPSTVPRQQFAFGPSPGPMQMAGGPLPMMAQPQMAYQPPPMAQQQMAMQQPYNTVAYPPGSPAMQTAQMPAWPNGQSTAGPSFSPLLPIPAGGGTVTLSEPSTPALPDSNTAPVPAPVPDPQFSSGTQSSPPITSVSNSAVSETEAPEVEAF